MRASVLHRLQHRPTAADGLPVREEAVQRWVDASYEPIADAYLAEVRRRISEYRRDVIETNRPLESHEELEQLFDDQSDGTEVVPLSFKVEHQRRLEHRTV